MTQLTVDRRTLVSQGLFFCALSRHLPGVATLGANSCFGTGPPTHRPHSMATLRWRTTRIIAD